MASRQSNSMCCAVGTKSGIGRVIPISHSRFVSSFKKLLVQSGSCVRVGISSLVQSNKCGKESRRPHFLHFVGTSLLASAYLKRVAQITLRRTVCACLRYDSSLKACLISWRVTPIFRKIPSDAGQPCSGAFVALSSSSSY